MKRLLFFLAGLMLMFAQTSNAQMLPPPIKIQASVVSSMMNSLSVLVTWPDVYVAIYPMPENFVVFKKNGSIADTTKFQAVWMTREGKFMDHNVKEGNTYSYYVVARYRNQPDVVSDTVQIIVSETNNILAKVSGKVFDAATLAPLRHARIEFIPNGMVYGPGSMGTTDSTGTFLVKVQPGDYIVVAETEGYQPLFYDNAQSFMTATKLTLNDGDSVSIDFGLTAFVVPNLYTVSGTVKDASGNPQKAMISVVSNNRVPNQMPDPRGHCFAVRTDDQGNFKIRAKENDTLVLFIDPQNHSLQKQFYNNKTTFETADRIVVTQDVTGIDVTLNAKQVYANGITGAVTDSATANPIPARVFAFQKFDNHGNRHPGRMFVLADSVTGVYSIANLEPGTYYLAAASRGYIPTFFKFDGTTSHNWHNADSVVVTESGIVENINFSLHKMDSTGNAFVYGFISDGNGNNVAGVLTSLVDGSGKVVSSTISEIDGSYVLEGLSSGSYQLTTSTLDYSSTTTSNVTLETSNNYTSVNMVMSADGITSVENPGNTTVTSYALNQNYPNPFNPSTVITYQIPTSGLVTVKVYNVIGKEIATLVNEVQPSGTYTKEFNAANLSSGVYFYTIKSGEFTATKKMILLK